MNTGAIDCYNIAATPTLADPWATNYFGAAQPGAVSDFLFYWPYESANAAGCSCLAGFAAIAASPDGRQFAVTDICNNRAMVYNSGATPSVVKRYATKPIPFPDADTNVGTGTITTGWLQYTVTNSGSDPVYGKPWAVTDNWMPTNGNDGGNYGYIACQRKLSNGIEYLYYLTSNNSWTIYQLNTNGVGAGMRESVVVSETADYTGPLLVQTDTNGDGIVGDQGDTTTQNVNGWYQWDCYPWVDTNGNLWYPEATLNGVTGTAELPLLGFDSANNPLYNWNAAIIVCPDTSNHARYDPNYNRLFMITIIPSRQPEIINYSGSAIEVYEASTGRRSLIFDPGIPSGSPLQDTIAGLTVDPSGDYFYTGHIGGYGQYVNMYTWDGLLVANAVPGTLSGNSAGWFDQPNCDLAAVNYDGTYYLYAEDDAYGRCIRYAFTSTGENFTTRSCANFAWAAPPPANSLPASQRSRGLGVFLGTAAPRHQRSPANDLLGWWKFDESCGTVAADSSGNGWDGYVANTTWNPAGGRLGGALSFNGSSSVLALPNFMLDNSSPTMTFACWIKTSANGVILADQDYPGTGSFRYVFTPMLYIGTDGYLRASISAGCSGISSVPGGIITSPTVVNDNNWHHLAFVVGMYNDTLYVDGVAVGTFFTGVSSPTFTSPYPPQGGIYCQLGSGVVGTSAANTWPGCAGPGAFFYNGLLDDARLLFVRIDRGASGDVGRGRGDAGTDRHPDVYACRRGL